MQQQRGWTPLGQNGGTNELRPPVCWLTDVIPAASGALCHLLFAILGSAGAYADFSFLFCFPISGFRFQVSSLIPPANFCF